MSSLNILIADDSKIVVHLLTNMFKELGHNIAGTASNGAEALDKYIELKPDLVTMDITMPKVDGIQATKNIMAHDPDALVIVITSHGQEQMIVEAVEAGAKGYILKPFRKENIDKQIKQILKKYNKS
ncbi:MAG: response regulator [Desulfonatronovibrio sp.]